MNLKGRLWPNLRQYAVIFGMTGENYEKRRLNRSRFEPAIPLCRRNEDASLRPFMHRVVLGLFRGLSVRAKCKTVCKCGRQRIVPEVTDIISFS